MVSLIQNENMKIYRRIRTWIMTLLLVLLVLAISLINFYAGNGQQLKSNWRVQLEEQQVSLRNIQAEPDLDANYEQHLNEELSMIEYRLDNNMPPEYATMWGPMLDQTGLIFLITLFVVIIAGDSLAGEFSTGTIKLLLIRPVSRLKILLSKYCSTIIYGIFLLLLLFISSFLINGVLYGFTGWNHAILTTSTEGIIQQENPILHLWKTYLLSSISTIMFVTLAFMISSVFRSSSMAIGIAMFSMFAGTLATAFFQQYSWSKYSLFANIDLTQHLGGYPFRDEMTMGFSITVLVVYFVVFNVLSWAVFTRRDVAA